MIALVPVSAGSADSPSPFGTEILDEAKVDDLHQVSDAAAVHDENVAGFDVAMDQAGSVGLRQRRRGLIEQMDDARFGLWAVDLHDFVERGTLQ